MQWKPVEIVRADNVKIIINEVQIESIVRGPEIGSSKQFVAVIQMSSGTVHECTYPHYQMWHNDILISQ